MSLATDHPLVVVVVGGGALWYGADRFVESAVALARRFGLSDVVTGEGIGGVGTSAPDGGRLRRRRPQGWARHRRRERSRERSSCEPIGTLCVPVTSSGVRRSTCSRSSGPRRSIEPRSVAPSAPGSLVRPCGSSSSSPSGRTTSSPDRGGATRPRRARALDGRPARRPLNRRTDRLGPARIRAAVPLAGSPLVDPRPAPATPSRRRRSRLLPIRRTAARRRRAGPGCPRRPRR